MTEYGYGKSKVDISDVKSVNPDELTEEKVKKIINSVMRKFNCPECDSKIIFQRVSGHNSRPECDKCGSEYVI